MTTIDFIKNKTPDIRHLFDMKEVVFNQEWLKNEKNKELYYMYRGMGLSSSDKEKIVKARLRYDITVIPSLMLNEEFNKTAGHYHSNQTTGISYPEIYEVLEGEAYYLMQSTLENNSIDDAYFVHAKTGDKIIIPPNYGHFTINASNKKLIMANWISLDCISDYNEIKQKQGACYYAIKDNEFQNNTNIRWVPNNNYHKITKLRELKPTNFSELGLTKEKEMYGLIDNLEKLNFLNKPENYKELWKRIIN